MSARRSRAREVKLAVLAIAVLPLMILGFTALASVTAGRAGRAAQQGAARLLARSSTPSPRRSANNGSAFAGLTAGTPFYNGLLGVAMWVGRFFMIVPMLAIAGSLAAKKYTPEGAGSFPTTGGAVGRPARRHHPDPRRPHLPAEPRARPHRRSSRDDQRPALLTGRRTWHAPQPNRLFTAELIAAGDRRRLPQARSAPADPQPGDVHHRVVALLLTVLLVVGSEQAGARLPAPARRLAVADRAVRHLRRSAGRRARQGAGGSRCAPPRPSSPPSG